MTSAVPIRRHQIPVLTNADRPPPGPLGRRNSNAVRPACRSSGPRKGSLLRLWTRLTPSHSGIWRQLWRIRIFWTVRRYILDRSPLDRNGRSDRPMRLLGPSADRVVQEADRVLATTRHHGRAPARGRGHHRLDRWLKSRLFRRAVRPRRLSLQDDVAGDECRTGDQPAHDGDAAGCHRPPRTWAR